MSSLLENEIPIEADIDSPELQMKIYEENTAGYKETEETRNSELMRENLTTATPEQIQLAKAKGLGQSSAFAALEAAPFNFDIPDDETNIRRSSENEIIWITFDKLIDKIICGDSDTNLIKIMIHNYPLVCTYPEQLFLALVKRTMIPDIDIMAPSERENFKKRYMRPMRAFFTAAIRQWINERPADFAPNTGLTQLLDEYIEYAIIKDNGQDEQIKTNLDLIRRRVSGKISIDFGLPSNPIEEPSFQVDPGLGPLLSVPWRFLAEQLTLLHKSKISAIKPDELIGRAWEKVGQEKRTKNVRKLKDMFNNFLMMVIIEILSCSDTIEAGKLLKKLIDIAHYCKTNLGNYETPFYINTVLLSEPIAILKSAIAQVNSSPQHRDAWVELQKTYDPEGRYQQVRREMELNAQTVVPCFFALRNVLYSNDEQKTIQDGMINLTKLRINYSIINQLNSYKKKVVNNGKLLYIYEYLKAKNVTVYEENELLYMAEELEHPGEIETVN